MRLTLLAACLVSFSAMACPELSGTYVNCKGQTNTVSDVSEVMVSQIIRNGITTYTFRMKEARSNDISTEIYRADGKTQVSTQYDPESEMTVRVALTPWCQENKLWLKTNISINNENIVDARSQSYKIDNRLHIQTDAVNMGQEVREYIICE